MGRTNRSALCILIWAAYPRWIRIRWTMA